MTSCMLSIPVEKFPIFPLFCSSYNIPVLVPVSFLFARYIWIPRLNFEYFYEKESELIYPCISTWQHFISYIEGVQDLASDHVSVPCFRPARVAHGIFLVKNVWKILLFCSKQLFSSSQMCKLPCSCPSLLIFSNWFFSIGRLIPPHWSNQSVVWDHLTMCLP